MIILEQALPLLHKYTELVFVFTLNFLFEIFTFLSSTYVLRFLFLNHFRYVSFNLSGILFSFCSVLFSFFSFFFFAYMLHVSEDFVYRYVHFFVLVKNQLYQDEILTLRDRCKLTRLQLVNFCLCLGLFCSISIDISYTGTVMFTCISECSFYFDRSVFVRWFDVLTFLLLYLQKYSPLHTCKYVKFCKLQFRADMCDPIVFICAFSAKHGSFFLLPYEYSILGF